MKKTEINALITLSFATAFFDFLTASDTQFIFARDRIMHILISCGIAFVAICILQLVNINNYTVKIISLGLIGFRIVSVYLEAIKYYETFHGANTIAITIFSVCVALIYFKYSKDKLHLIYMFFVISNISVLLLVTVLSLKNINIINLYSNSLAFEFSVDKLYMFFDIFTIAVISEDRKQCKSAQIKYLTSAAGVFILITLLQGLCVNGNLMYSISSLQSLMQIFTGETIKRYDYIITIYQTLNYFAAVILYMWALYSIFKNKEGAKNEII